MTMTNFNNFLPTTPLKTVSDYYQYLNTAFPFALQDGWDNSGMQICLDPGVLATKPLLATDINRSVIKYATEQGSNLIITHHPLILGRNAVKNVISADFSADLNENTTEFSIHSALSAELINAGISHIALHTNLDKAHFGVGDAVATLLGLNNVQPIITSETDLAVMSATNGSSLQSHYTEVLGFLPGHGRSGDLTEAVTIADLASNLRQIMQLPNGFVHCNKSSSEAEYQQVQKVAILPGSGESMIDEALKFKPDVIITSDLKHHTITDINTKLAFLGLNTAIIAVPHSAIEGLVFGRNAEFANLPFIANLLPEALLAPAELSLPWGFAA